MAAYFVDSSALVKRYVREIGTPWVRDLTRRDAGHELYVARISAVEVTSAVARRRRGKSVTARQASSILHQFRSHLAGRYVVVEITPALLDRAMELADTHGLRAYDAVQLAAALALSEMRDAGFDPLTLISADQDLNAAASAEGLAAENPNLHA